MIVVGVSEDCICEAGFDNTMLDVDDVVVVVVVVLCIVYGRKVVASSATVQSTHYQLSAVLFESNLVS